MTAYNDLRVAEDKTLNRRVEHCDIDGYGVVHFSRYAAFCETAALEMLGSLGLGLSDLEVEGTELRVRQLRIRYRAAAKYGDELMLSAKLQYVGLAHILVLANVSRRETVGDPSVLADGELDLVFVGAVTGNPIPVPLALTAQEETL
jgi:acyl-CoA thioester hydrolase